MTVDARYYRNMILEAVKENDRKTLDALANNLAEAEESLSMLRAKGYGTHGMSVAATARQVPPSCRKVLNIKETQ